MFGQDFEVGVHRLLLCSEFLVLKTSEFSLEQEFLLKWEQKLVILSVERDSQIV